MTDFKEQLPRKLFTRAQMSKRVARFDQLKGFDGGLADSRHPSALRTLYNVIGFQPPDDETGAIGSPVGKDAARNAAIKISEGFNLGYCRAKPGKGPMLHNHDTNETFICMTGVWRAAWLAPGGAEEFVDLNPLDAISFPPGAIRRFMNVKRGPKGADGILMFVIGGNAPNAEFSMESMAELAQLGLSGPASRGKPRPGAQRAEAGVARRTSAVTQDVTGKRKAAKPKVAGKRNPSAGRKPVSAKRVAR